MSMNKYNLEDTIAAISTPLGEGGIGIVRISGRKALEIADKIFLSKDGSKPSEYHSFTIHYGHIVERSAGRKQIVDEVLLTVMRAPRTYTREDIVEINCHSGIVPLGRILELALKEGARLAQPGEFTLRAFLKGRIDLTQAEAVLDIVRAKTEKSLEIASQQLAGKFSQRIRELKEKILNIYAELEASIDFPEEDLELQDRNSLLKEVKKVKGVIEELLNNSDKGMIFREGISVVICGKPNVGKSSLMNLLLKKNRCIVSPFPGTTRDAIEEWINIEGIPLRLIDTAGITKSRNILDGEAIKRSQDYLKIADMVLFMLDGSRKITNDDMRIFQMLKEKPKIILVNKKDLPQKYTLSELKKIFKGDLVRISCLTEEGIERLCQKIRDFILKGNVIDQEGYLVTNLRHKEALIKAKDCLDKVSEGLTRGAFPELVILDLKEALENLQIILGENFTPDILERIFSQFCIGK